MRRPLLLNGFMATGKSSVGKLVAAKTKRPFIDLDARIEARARMSVAEIFARLGEPEFRALERAELAEVLRSPGANAPVVSLGGGALLGRESRLDALDRAVVVTLDATADTILERVGDASSRPLLSGPDRRLRVLELLAARAGAYAESHARIATDRQPVAALAEQVEGVWRRDPIAVAAGAASYAVDVGSAILETRLPACVGTPSRTVLVSDETVFGLHGTRVANVLDAPLIVRLPPGEQNKHIGSIELIWRAALEASADRKARFVALGGGVVTDMTGFAAATYMRGVSWVGAPTTLLAMVDASVGGKTGVDLLSAKNAVGAFWQPAAVVCDVDVLATESLRGFRSALAEVIKTAIIGDPELLTLLEENLAVLMTRPPELVSELVRRSIRVKARIVSADERESGLRAVLNLGHTVGHALEAVAGYTRLTHGEAISLGLVAALRIGVALAVTPQELCDRVTRLLEGVGLPTDLHAEPLSDAVRLIAHDKKRSASKLKFILASGPGQVRALDLGLQELESLVLSLRGAA